MVRIFSTVTLILMILLFPPAVLALISNDAVPGQVTYPIKRTLEAGILFAASVNPTTKAMFTVQRSERRFKEVSLLIDSGDRSQTVNQTLEEFVSQTKEAAEVVKKIKDPVVKKQRTTKLKESIVQYKQGLEVQQKKISDEGGYVTPSVDSVTQIPSVTQSPKPTSNPITPTVSQIFITPVPTSSVPMPTHIPGLTPVPTPIPNVQEPDCTDPNLSEAMQKALNCLDNINEGLDNNETEIPNTAADEAPAADEALPTQEPEPQPTEEPTPIIEPTIEPTPDEPSAIKQIKHNLNDSNVVITDTPKEVTPTP